MGLLQKPRSLRNCRHFADLDQREMRMVCDAGQEVTVPERWSFIWENTPGDRAYLLLDGPQASRRCARPGRQRGCPADLGGRPGSVVADREFAAALDGESGLQLRRIRRVSVRGYRSLEPWVLRRHDAEPS